MPDHEIPSFLRRTPTKGLRHDDANTASDLCRNSDQARRAIQWAFAWACWLVSCRVYPFLVLLPWAGLYAHTPGGWSAFKTMMPINGKFRQHRSYIWHEGQRVFLSIPGMCPYPIGDDMTASACIARGECGCSERE